MEGTKPNRNNLVCDATGSPVQVLGSGVDNTSDEIVLFNALQRLSKFDHEMQMQTYWSRGIYKTSVSVCLLQETFFNCTAKHIIDPGLDTAAISEKLSNQAEEQS